MSEKDVSATLPSNSNRTIILTHELAQRAHIWQRHCAGYWLTPQRSVKVRRKLVRIVCYHAEGAGRRGSGGSGGRGTGRAGGGGICRSARESPLSQAFPDDGRILTPAQRTSPHNRGSQTGSNGSQTRSNNELRKYAQEGKVCIVPICHP